MCNGLAVGVSSSGRQSLVEDRPDGDVGRGGDLRHGHVVGAASSNSEVATSEMAPSSAAGSVSGVDRVFLYAEPSGVDGFVAAARDAGVRQVVVLSSATASSGCRIRSRATRPPTSATSPTSPTPPRPYCSRGPVAPRRDGTHADRARVADPAPQVRIDPVPRDEARAFMTATMPTFVVDSLLGYWAETDGRSDRVTDAVESIAGRPARTFATWAREIAVPLAVS